MKEYTWMDMMEKMQDIRLFSSLHIRRSKKEGITSAQEMDLLSRIVFAPAPLTPQELTAQMGLCKSAVSRLIEHLEKKEFLSKQCRASDKRSYILFITEKGKHELDQTYRYYLEPIYQLKEALGNDAFDSLTTQIKHANQLLQEKNRRI